MSTTHIRRLIAVAIVAFALPVGLSTVAVAQETTQTDTTTLGDYSQTLPEETVADPASEVEDETESGGGGSAPAQTSAGGSAPAQAATAPRQLAFTGFEAWIVGFAGIALMGTAVIMQRRRRA